MVYNWIIFALLSAVTASFVAIFGKIGLEGVDSNTATFVRAVIMALFLALVILFQGKLNEVSSIVKDFRVFKFIILSGIAGALSWLFYFLALKSGKVSQIVPIDRLSIVFAIILAAIIVGEKVTAKTAVGAIIITVGAIIIAI